ncbi:unnamed protein product [Colias eurytheme]|nr:unnamed protein product [Colias eurytheme]
MVEFGPANHVVAGAHNFFDTQPYKIFIHQLHLSRPPSPTYEENCQNWRAFLKEHAGASERDEAIVLFVFSERGLRIAANLRREVCGGKNVCFGVPIAERRTPQPRPAPEPAPANAS